MSMKTFEERLTAWIDGELEGPALEQFEQELAANPSAASEKAAAHRLGGLLREHGAPELTNTDFFNHQLMERIRSDDAHPATAAPRTFWSIPRMAWAGAFSLLIALALFRFVVPPSGERNQPASHYLAELLDVRAVDPSISATGIEKDAVAVVWLEGLDYLPESYALK